MDMNEIMERYSVVKERIEQIPSEENVGINKDSSGSPELQIQAIDPETEADGFRPEAHHRAEAGGRTPGDPQGKIRTMDPYQ